MFYGSLSLETELTDSAIVYDQKTPEILLSLSPVCGVTSGGTPMPQVLEYSGSGCHPLSKRLWMLLRASASLGTHEYFIKYEGLQEAFMGS